MGEGGRSGAQAYLLYLSTACLQQAGQVEAGRVRAMWPAGDVQVVSAAVIILKILVLMVFCASRAAEDWFSDIPWR